MEEVEEEYHAILASVSCEDLSNSCVHRSANM